MPKNISLFPARAIDEGTLFPAAFKVLAALCTYVNKNDTCSPCLKEVGSRLKVSKQAISRQIKILSEKGYIVSTPQYREDGSRTGNLYKIKNKIHKYT